MKMRTNKPASFIACCLAIAALITTSIMLNGCSGSCVTMQEVSLAKVNGNFTSLLMVTPNEGWAVGLSDTMLHYKDGRWSALAIPHFMTGLAKVSDSELWAVGGQSYMMHYQNGCWQEDDSLVNNSPLNDVQPSLQAVAMLSKDEGWAVGNRVAHYQNGSWKLTNGPGGYGLDMLSANEGWAVGELGMIAHYKDGAWQMVAWPEQKQIQLEGTPFGNAELRKVKMVSADEGWAVGDAGFIVHYSNGQWHRVESPTHQRISDLQMLSANEGWAASWGGILHYSNGKWEIADSHSAQTLYMLSASEGWAIGRSILHYQNGKWQEVAKLGSTP